MSKNIHSQSVKQEIVEVIGDALLRRKAKDAEKVFTEEIVAKQVLLDNHKKPKSVYDVQEQKKNCGLKKIKKFKRYKEKDLGSMKFKDLLFMNELFVDYIDQLDVDRLSKPDLATLANSLDLHGSMVKVFRCKSPDMMGLTGMVVMETANTLQIMVMGNKIKVLLKKDCSFLVKLGSRMVELFLKDRDRSVFTEKSDRKRERTHAHVNFASTCL
eukprot:TRINITY_DN32606_c0_g1_i1.p1 TRINITY_DN32606_c0_g1~~TRINITY_DN32606_c0_g1_i1.p1  ORF type:complete len:214 (+),score=52.48 TRINITY_DN32606_c0_g1_i1:150-791(+)